MTTPGIPGLQAGEDVNGTNEDVDQPSGLELRDEAERQLRALVGERARLWEDQWTAISALVAERRRALEEQRTGS